MSGEDNGQAAPAPQAMCGEHPDRVAAGTCARCGNYYCAACAGRREGAQGFCRRCDDSRSYVAWEDAQLGPFARYFETIKSSLAELPKFAAELPLQGGYARPLLFACLPTLASSLITAVAMAAVVGVSWVDGTVGGDPDTGLFVALGFAVYFFGGLVGYLAYLLIWSAVLVASAHIAGSRGLHYEGLFRILCYASGLNWLYFFPVVGVLVAVYHVVVAVSCIGARGHMSALRALGVYGLPALVFSSCCCGSYVLLLLTTMR
jgi:hypothetical protein